MYQAIVVDDERAVDWYEVLQAMPADGKSMIVLSEESKDANRVSEFASARIH